MSKKALLVFLVFIIASLQFAEAQSPPTLNGYQLNANQAKWVEYIAKEVVPKVGADIAARGTWWTLKEGVLDVTSPENPTGYSNCAPIGNEYRNFLYDKCGSSWPWQVGVAAVQVPNHSDEAVRAKARELHPGISENEIIGQAAELAGYPKGSSEYSGAINSTGRLRRSLLLRDPAIGFALVYGDIEPCLDSSRWQSWCQGYGAARNIAGGSAAEIATNEKSIAELTSYYKNFSAGALSVDEEEEQKEISLGLAEQIAKFYAWALGLGGLVALGVLIFGGILYTTSAGNASRQDDAKQWITGAFVGLIILFGSFFILNTINPELTKLTDLKLLANKALNIDDNSGFATCIPGTAVAGGSTVIVLDPGHSPTTVKETDPATGLETSDFEGASGERQSMWDTAQIIKAKLEAAGYKVVLTKSSADDAANFVDKVRIANNSGAALAVSLHYDGVGTFGVLTSGQWGVTPQEVGRFRENKSNGKRVIFNDAALAAKSQQYAQIIAEERNKVGDKTKVVPLTSSFPKERSATPAWGDISIVQLIGKVPWVYNETGAKGFDEQKYAEGIANGIMRAVPPGTAGTASSGNCARYEAFAALARSYATPSIIYADSPPSDPRHQAYAKAPPTARKGDTHGSGCYGADCGVYVATVVQQTIDPDWPDNWTGNMADYVTRGKGREKFDVIQNPGADTSKLQAGDILLSIDPYGTKKDPFDDTGHISIWLDDAVDRGEYEASWSSAGCVSASLPHGPVPQPSPKMTQIIRYKYW